MLREWDGQYYRQMEKQVKGRWEEGTESVCWVWGTGAKQEGLTMAREKVQE